MSEEHEHTIRYTIYLSRWWGSSTLVLVGKASSLKDGELLVFDTEGGFISINYARILYMMAEPIH